MALTVPAPLVDEVRNAVRQRGVDPVRDPVAVRRLAEDVARRHEQRSLTGAVEALDDEPGAVGEIVAQLSGLGPLQPLLDDADVEEIWINATECHVAAGQRLVSRHRDTARDTFADQRASRA